MDLAHNHILDSGLEGAFTTANAFKKVGIDPIGVYEKPVRDKAPLLIKNVNGIKIAILSYSYGYNGLDSNLTKKEVADHLSNLDEKRMKAEIERAEKKLISLLSCHRWVLSIVWNRQKSRLLFIIR